MIRTACSLSTMESAPTNGPPTASPSSDPPVSCRDDTAGRTYATILRLIALLTLNWNPLPFVILRVCEDLKNSQTLSEIREARNLREAISYLSPWPGRGCRARRREAGEGFL